MSPKLAIQELLIIVAAKKHNPIVLTIDFLKYSGIVPTDWELLREPLVTHQVCQIAFTNGVNILAQSDTITFSEPLEAQGKEKVIIPEIARNYAHTLSHAEYQAVAINPRSFVTFPNEGENAARNYITSTLLAPSNWQKIGKELLKATFVLSYRTERGQLNLTIDEARLQLPGKPTQSAVLVSGSFPYEVVGDTPERRVQSLSQLIDNWQADLETYREIIHQNFDYPKSVL